MRKRFLEKLLKILKSIYYNIVNFRNKGKERSFYCSITLSNLNEILYSNTTDYYFGSGEINCKYNTLLINRPLVTDKEKSIIIGVRLDPDSCRSSTYYPGCSTFKLYDPIRREQIFFLDI